MKHRWSIVWIVALWLLCGDARAQSARDEARELAREGIALLDEGKHEEGLAKLRDAESKFHAPTHLVYMARAYTALGNHIEAHRLYVGVLVEKVPNYAPVAFHEAQKNAAKEARALESKIAALRVAVKGARGARVTIDGGEVPGARLAHPIAVESGRHRIEASAGGATAAQEADAFTGKITEVTLAIEAPAGEDDRGTDQPGPRSPEEEPASAFPIGAGVAFGIGGAALIVGTVTGILTLQRADEIKSTCTDNNCPADQLTPADDAKLLGNVSTAMFVVGGAGVVLGAVFLIVDATQEEQARMRLRVEAKVGPTGAVLRGTF